MFLAGDLIGRWEHGDDTTTELDQRFDQSIGRCESSEEKKKPKPKQKKDANKRFSLPPFVSSLAVSWILTPPVSLFRLSSR